MHAGCQSLQVETNSQAFTEITSPGPGPETDKRERQTRETDKIDRQAKQTRETDKRERQERKTRETDKRHRQERQTR